MNIQKLHNIHVNSKLLELNIVLQVHKIKFKKH